MAYCAYCGALLPADARFCSSCGAAVTQETAAASVSPTIAATVYTGDGYAVMLVGNGSCSLSTAVNLISDICGYTDAEALNLVSNAPTLIARSLSHSQAAYLAQCLTEYGIEAAIYDRNGHQTFLSDVSSVFDNNGSLLTKVAGALGLIGIGNRIAGAVRRITLPSRPPVYTLPKPMPRPPVRRHDLHHAQPPRPEKPLRSNVPSAGNRPGPGPQAHRPDAQHQEPKRSQRQSQRRSLEQPPHGNRSRPK